MKNISLYLNIVLIIAVTLLYVDRFTGKSNSDDEQQINTTTDSLVVNNNDYVYINVDSLLNGYDYYNDLKTELIKNQKKLELSLNSKSKALERKALEFRQKVEKHLVTQKQAQQIQEQLMYEQQGLMKLKEQLQLQLMEQEQNMNRMLYQTIYDYLRDYNKKSKHKLIISNTTLAGNLLYADEKLNITNSVLNGLNNKYQEGIVNSETKDDKK